MNDLGSITDQELSMDVTSYGRQNLPSLACDELGGIGWFFDKSSDLFGALRKMASCPTPIVPGKPSRVGPRQTLSDGQ